MIGKVLTTVTTIISLSVTFVTVFQLTLFLSSLSDIGDFGNITSFYPDADEDEVSFAIWSSIVDISFVIIFILQHSFSTTVLNKFMSYVNADHMQRVIYNLFSSIMLQVLMLFWNPIPKYVLWNITLEERPILQMFFITLHALSWLVFYMMTISLDITEILGIKWVYYYVMGYVGRNQREHQQQSMVYSLNKSKRFSSLKNSVQHPGFICLAVILWIYPAMRLDRLFLAVIWTVYMALAWDVDDNDLNYIVEQRQKKFSL